MFPPPSLARSPFSALLPWARRCSEAAEAQRLRSIWSLRLSRDGCDKAAVWPLSGPGGRVSRPTSPAGDGMMGQFPQTMCDHHSWASNVSGEGSVEASLLSPGPKGLAEPDARRGPGEAWKYSFSGVGVRQGCGTRCEWDAATFCGATWPSPAELHCPTVGRGSEGRSLSRSAQTCPFPSPTPGSLPAASSTLLCHQWVLSWFQVAWGLQCAWSASRPISHRRFSH